MVATTRVSSLKLVIILTPISTIIISSKRSVHLVLLRTHIHVFLTFVGFLNIHFWWLLICLSICQLLQFLLKGTKIHVIIYSGGLYYWILVNQPFLDICLIFLGGLSVQLLFLPFSRLFCGNLCWWFNLGYDDSLLKFEFKFSFYFLVFDIFNFGRFWSILRIISSFFSIEFRLLLLLLSEGWCVGVTETHSTNAYIGSTTINCIVRVFVNPYRWRRHWVLVVSVELNQIPLDWWLSWRVCSITVQSCVHLLLSPSHSITHFLMLAWFIMWVRSSLFHGWRKLLVLHYWIIVSTVHATCAKSIVGTLKIGLITCSFWAHVARYLTSILGIIVRNTSTVDHGHLQGAVFDETVWYWLQGAFGLDFLLLFKESCKLGLEVIGIAWVKHWDLVHLGLVDYLGTDDTPDPWCFLSFSHLDYDCLALLLLFFGILRNQILAGIKWILDSLTINIVFGLILNSLFYGCSSLEEFASEGFDSFLFELAGLPLVFLFVFIHRKI